MPARVKTHVGGLKLGLEFFAANGPDGVREMAELGLPIFLDLKLHDIPNTVAKAVQALRPLEPAILTVHAAGGRAMLEDAKAAAPLGHQGRRGDRAHQPRRERSRRRPASAATPHDQVERLAELAREAGLDGIVCSGAEVAARASGLAGRLLRRPRRPPGRRRRRPTRSASSRRAQALDAGASILVIGRPITEAEDPGEAARAIAATL